MKYSTKALALLITISFLICSSTMTSMAVTNEEFFAAIADYKFDRVQQLINEGIDINCKNKDGRTGLIIACQNNDLGMVKFLVSKGVKLDLTDTSGNTALIIAAENGFNNIAEFLVKSGASISIRNESKNSVLDCADINLLKVILKRPNEKMTKEMWRKDLKYLADELPKLHPNLFFKLKKNDFKKAIAQLDSDIPNMNDLKIKVGMAKAVAMIGDGHTNLQLWRKLKKYPIEFYYFPDGLYVYKVTGKYKKALKCRLIKVGHTDIKKVIGKLKTVFPYENDAAAKSYINYYINAPEILAGLGIISDMQKGEFVLKDSIGKTFSLYLSPIKENEKVNWSSVAEFGKEPLTLRLSEAREAYSYKYFRDTKTLYFEYNRCKDVPDKPFESFARELLQFIDSHQVDKFIIDLSANGGGNSGVISPLLDGIKKRVKINKKGRLFGIIGNETCSSAVTNAVQLKNETNITFVGQPAGQELNNYGDYKLIMLPNSHLIASCSTKHFVLSKKDETVFMPDIAVSISSKNYFAGKDPVLDAILKYKAK